MTRHLGHGGMPLLDLLGVHFTGAEGGTATGRWCPSELACNPRGATQGGIFTVVLDAAMSLALHSALPPGEAAVSVQLGTSQPLPARLGAPLTVTAEVVRLGRRMIFATATVTDSEGGTVAFGTGTFARMPSPRRATGLSGCDEVS